jgi:TRAP-type C4-dicarboxylate transport system substrate-binding protein
MTITRRQFVVTSCAVASMATPVHQAFAAVQLNLSSVLPDGNFMVQNARKYAEAVAKATGGEVNINLRPGGLLGF